MCVKSCESRFTFPMCGVFRYIISLIFFQFCFFLSTTLRPTSSAKKDTRNANDLTTKFLFYWFIPSQAPFLIEHGPCSSGA